MEKNKIRSIKGREILDSKGTPTVEVDLTADTGLYRAAVPSGVSTGATEAAELRDGGARYGGKGVIDAVNNINTIIKETLVGQDVINQEKIDGLMISLDGTEYKSKLGANAILAVSIAVSRAAAGALGIPLYQYIAKISGSRAQMPKPGILMIEGGMHAGGKIDFQEYIVIPSGENYHKMLERGVNIYRVLQKNIKAQFGEASLNVGYEGALTPPLDDNETPLQMITEAIKEVGGDGDQLFIDAAAAAFYKDGKYRFEGNEVDKKALVDFYRRIINKYPIFALEDGLNENDFAGFSDMVKEFGQRIKIVGDDLLTTNIKRIKAAIQSRSCNGLILKPNQVGTVTETINAAKVALNAGWKVFVKHRGGESNDDFIADLAVGLGTRWLLSGAPARGERVAKYNQLLRIEEELG